MIVRAEAAKNSEYPFLSACFAASIRLTSFTFQLTVWLAISVVAAKSVAQTSAPVGISISMPTEARVKSPGWWPTKGDASRDSYVGTAVCAKCHGSKVATQQSSAMAQAAVRAADAEVLRQHDHLLFRARPLSRGDRD